MASQLRSNLHSHCHENIISSIKSSAVTFQYAKMSSWVISHVEIGSLSGVSENVTVSRQGRVTCCMLHLHPRSMLTAVPAWTTGAGQHDRLTQRNVHPAVCIGTADSVLCGYNKTCSYVIITSTLDDGDRDSLWKVRSQLYLQTADCLWRFQCI
jgi:hypothetical protein